MTIWTPITAGGIRLGTTKIEVWYEGDLALVDAPTASDFRDLTTGFVGGPPFGVWFGMVRVGIASLVEDAKKIAVQFESNMRDLGVDTEADEDSTPASG